ACIPAGASRRAWSGMCCLQQERGHNLDPQTRYNGKTVFRASAMETVSEQAIRRQIQAPSLPTWQARAERWYTRGIGVYVTPLVFFLLPPLLVTGAVAVGHHLGEEAYRLGFSWLWFWSVLVLVIDPFVVCY